jgi:excisionase family DNA binding protein
MHDHLEPRLYSVAAGAILLGGVSERHVHGLIAAGRIRCVRIGRRVMIPREVIDQIVLEGVPEVVDMARAARAR